MKLKSLILFVFTISICFLLEAIETKKVQNAHIATQNTHISVQNAHLAGSWYPKDKTELKKDLDYYFSLASKYFKIINGDSVTINGNINGDTNNNTVTALIVPHAGHYFSGLCAATAYQAINNKITKQATKQELNNHTKSSTTKSSFDRVVIMGPSHSANFDGIALPDYDIYRTPMGEIPVDKKAVSSLLDKSSLFKIIPGVHQKEHSIEIQLPFLQFCLDNFAIVPLVVGKLDTQDFKTIAQAIGELFSDNKKTLIVASSDFIHYGTNFGYTPAFENVAKFDKMAIQAILDKSYTEFDSIIKKTGATICGRDPIKILLKIIELGFFGQPEQVEWQLTSYYNSAQLEASRSSQLEKSRNDKQIDVTKLSQAQEIEAKSSVSYAGLICKSKMTLQEEHILLTLARNAITKKLFPEKKLSNNLINNFELTGNLKKMSGAFVTLKTKTGELRAGGELKVGELKPEEAKSGKSRSGELRGCIGRIIADEPLYKTIPEIALSSAFQDSRFSPLTKNELANITISITILTPPHYVNSYNDIIIGKHGVILEKTVNGHIRSAVFLPQVAGEQGWDLIETLENLSQKAGLAKDAWKNGCKFKVFEGFEFGE